MGIFFDFLGRSFTVIRMHDISEDSLSAQKSIGRVPEAGNVFRNIYQARSIARQASEQDDGAFVDNYLGHAQSFGCLIPLRELSELW